MVWVDGVIGCHCLSTYLPTYLEIGETEKKGAHATWVTQHIVLQIEHPELPFSLPTHPPPHPIPQPTSPLIPFSLSSSLPLSSSSPVQPPV